MLLVYFCVLQNRNETQRNNRYKLMPGMVCDMPEQ